MIEWSRVETKQKTKTKQEQLFYFPNRLAKLLGENF